MDEVKKKYLLGLNLAGSLGVLGLFKYFDFGIEQLNNLALPFAVNDWEGLLSSIPNLLFANKVKYDEVVSPVEVSGFFISNNLFSTTNL